MEGNLVRLYIDRASDFYSVMDLTRDEADYRTSAALLAIHSAICYADALRIGLGDTALSADNHAEASRQLSRLLRERTSGDIAGIGHLDNLIGMKSAVSYGKKHLDADQLSKIVLHAERFARWASKIARQVKIEGWRYDD